MQAPSQEKDNARVTQVVSRTPLNATMISSRTIHVVRCRNSTPPALDELSPKPTHIVKVRGKIASGTGMNS